MDPLSQPDIATTAPTETAPQSPRRGKRHFMFWLLLALFVAWLLPNLVRLNYIQQEIAAALSANLGREVRIGDVHPHLVSGWESGMGLGLGVEVENVEIADDAQFGLEPMARIETVEARLAARSLWHARLEFSNVVLRNPSVNLVRSQAGDWNLLALPLGAMSGGSGSAPPEQYPDVRIVDGRLNFKLDGRKKAFYLTELYVEISAPRSATEAWEVKFAGTPSRTSFEQIPAIVVRGTGQFGPLAAGAAQQAGAPLKISWEARNALLGEIAAVMTGRDQGMHGTVSASGEATGTTTLFRVAGKAAIRDLHRWDVIPQAASMEIPAEFSGVLDLRGDVFQLARLILPLRTSEGEAGVVELAGAVQTISRNPQLMLDARAQGIALSALRVLSEPFGMKVDPAVSVSGRLDGHLEMHGAPEQWAGEVTIDKAEIARGTVAGGKESEKPTEQSAAVIRLAPITAKLAQGSYALGPVVAEFGEGAKLRVELSGKLPEPSNQIILRGDGVPVAGITPWLQAAWFPVAMPEGGTASLNLTVSHAPGTLPLYNGRVTIAKSKWQPGPWSEAVDVAQARLQFKNRSVQVSLLEARLQGAAWRGNVIVQLTATQVGGAAQPLQAKLDLRGERLDVDQLQQSAQASEAASPASQRSWLGGLRESPAVKESAAPQAWVVSGKLAVDALSWRGLALGHFTTQVEWADGRLRAEPFAADLGGGRVSGSFQMDLPHNGATAATGFAWNAEFNRVDLRLVADGLPSLRGQYAGLVSGKLRAEGHGANWPEAVRGLSGSGEFTGRNITLVRWQLPAAGPQRAEVASGTRTLQFAEVAAKLTMSGEGFSISQLESPTAGDGARARAARLRVSGTIGYDHSIKIAVEEHYNAAQPALEFRWEGSLAAPQLLPPPTLARNDAVGPH